MKFEQVLQIYWTKGFLYSGKVLPFSINWWRLSDVVQGLGLYNKLRILRRFELNELYYDTQATFANTDKEARKSLNRIFSQMTSINYQLSDLTLLNTIRLYLIKSFRGKAHAFGKPTRGQRTWSNAWTSYLSNKDLRIFISQVQKQLNKDKKEEKINYKMIKKKTQKGKNDGTPRQKTKAASRWF